MSIFESNTIRRAIGPIAAIAVLAACERKEPRAYTAPKETPFVPQSNAQADPHGQEPAHEREMWRPALKFTLPAGWTELGPDAANVARFSAGEATVAVTALVNMSGNEAWLVNMYRQGKGQAPLNDVEAAKTLADVPIAGGAGKMIDAPDSIVAFTHRREGSLFFKIQGSVEAVAAQKAAFFEFIKTAKLSEGSTPVLEAPDKAAVPAAESTPAKEVVANIPAGWNKVAPGPMQAAKFSVPEKDGKKAEVSVSIFPSDTGGTVANVKRWRVQLGMPDADDAAILASAKPIEGAEGAVIVNLENAGRSMIGAIVPRDGQWFFFKLFGDSPAVADARDAFVGFVKGGQ